MSEPNEPTMMVTRSVTVSEIMGDDGTLYLATSTEGDPATWDIVGMLTYSLEQHKREVVAFEDCD